MSITETRAAADFECCIDPGTQPKARRTVALELSEAESGALAERENQRKKTTSAFASDRRQRESSPYAIGKGAQHASEWQFDHADYRMETLLILARCSDSAV